MSCQQVSRLISTTVAASSSSVTPEDPYVFTETVPTTPPILFNTQKSRSRLTDTPQLAATITAATKKISNPKKFTPAQHFNANGGTKTQASFATTAATNFKNVTQSQKQQQQQQHWQQNKRIVTTTSTANVCIVRPQQKQHLQQLSPLPALLPHTPSLWQTPLLLDAVPPPTPTPAVAAPLSPALHILPLSSPPNPAPITQSTSATPATVIVTAMVTPLPPPPPPTSVCAATLPPSKFHHTTLAQHLQKVQCLKKPKKPSVGGAACPSIGSATATKPHDPAPALAAFVVETPQHSSPSSVSAVAAATVVSDDPNEIPVNVIFRKPPAQQLTATNVFVAGGSGAVDEPQTATPTPPAQLEKTSKISVKPAQKLKKVVKVITSPQPPHTIKATPPSQPLHLHAALPRGVVFVQPQAKPDMRSPAPLPLPPTQATAEPTASFSPVGAGGTPPRVLKAAKLEKRLQNEQAPYVVIVAQPTPPPPPPKTAYKRKASSCAANKVRTASGSGATAPLQLQKKFRKSMAFAAAADLCTRHERRFKGGADCSTNAMAVIKMSAAEIDADTSQLASTSVLPYCVQRHWLQGVYDARPDNGGDGGVSVLSATNIGRREERIAQHKSLLRRQALQLLATRSLQQPSLRAARRRLICVDRLLRKYQNHNEDENRLPPAAATKQCIVSACTAHALEMAAHCQQHITTHNATQQIFSQCTAKFADHTQCRIPVFDILHDLPLCAEHARKRDAYNRSAAAAVVCEAQRPRKSGGAAVLSSLSPLQLPQLQHYEEEMLPQMQHSFYNNNNSSIDNNINKKLAPRGNVATKATPNRKRKTTSGNPVGRPLKRAKKAAAAAAMAAASVAHATYQSQPQPPPPPPLSAVLQRKSSTTSLESIASNSHSSSSQSQTQTQQPTLHAAVAAASLAPPALAPLSGGGGNGSGGVSNRMLNFGTATNVTTVAASDLKAHEINQIVAQFAMVANNNNNNHSNYFHNNNHQQHSYNNNYNNHHHQQHQQFLNTNSNSNFTLLGLGSTSSSSATSSSLPTNDELLTQEMLSICENSSAYASSEDTGLGGLSETELMAGSAHDADEIPLADTRLLEEHDLANVLSALPVDAFNELFTAVRQDECDEVERALELADKHLKSLQQTIGGSDSDFLGDFLNDEMLADASMEMVMHSPDTSGIDTSTLFIDSSGSNSGAGGADIRRGLVQT